MPDANDGDLDPSLIGFNANPELNMRHERIREHFTTMMSQDHRLVALMLATRDGNLEHASRRLRAFLNAAERFRAAMILQTELRNWLEKVRRTRLAPNLKAINHTAVSNSMFFQASDHGREDFKSNLVAAFTLTIGLSQVVAMSPLVPEPPGGVGGIQLLEYSLPFGMGHLLFWLQESVPIATSPGLEPIQILVGLMIYIAYGFLWMLINIANVKGHGGRVWPLLLSTSWLILYLVWIVCQTEFKWNDTNYANIFDYEIGRAEMIKDSFQIGVAILLHWGSMILLVCTCVVYIIKLCRHCGTDNHKRRREEYLQLKRDMERLNQANHGVDEAKAKALIYPFWMRQLRRLLGVSNDPSFRVHLPVVLVAAFIASTLIVASTTIVLFVNFVPRILQIEDQILKTVPRLQQMLDERQALLGDDAAGIVNMARMLLITVLQIARHNLFLPAGVGVGAMVGPVLAIKGILHTLRTYSHTYDLLWKHGPTAMRYPLRRANSVRFFATFIAFQFCGFVLVVMVTAFISVVLVLLWEGDWPGAPLLRSFVLTVSGMQMMEMFIIRTVVVPLCQKLQCGPALFMLELWYLTSGFIKGFTRLLLLWFIPLLSFFTPAKCAFVDGMESWDSGHLTFVCYVMTRVERDKQLLRIKEQRARAAQETLKHSVRLTQATQYANRRNRGSGLRKITGRFSPPRFSMFSGSRNTKSRTEDSSRSSSAGPREITRSKSSPGGLENEVAGEKPGVFQRSSTSASLRASNGGRQAPYTPDEAP